MHGEDDFEHYKNAKLDERFPRSRDEIHHAARRLQHQKRQPEVPQDSESSPAAAAIDFQLWLDLRFEDFQVLMDAAGSHAAEFAVNQGQVGENGKVETYQHTAQSVALVRDNCMGK